MQKGINDSILHEFYAVTHSGRGSSLYKVSDVDDGYHGHATARKIALCGESPIPVGGKFGANMIAVCKGLIAYIPEEKGFAPGSKQIESVNNRFWAGGTSSIVGLFLNLKTASECFGEDGLCPCDIRWRTETQSVIEAIGDNHPFFSVSHSPELRLMP